MNALETLLLLANLLSFLAVARRRTRIGFWLRHAPIMTMAIAAAQVLTHGPRWQLVPAYTITVLCFLAWLMQRLAKVKGPAGRPRPHPLADAAAIGLGALGLAFAFALPIAAPVFRFPQPGGPHGIGTLTYHWTDQARAEVFANNRAERRQLMVQIWYPAQANLPGSHAAYIPDADAVMASFAHIHDVPPLFFGHFKHVTTHAIPSAQAASEQRHYPVLLFLQGATGFRQMNTFQVEHLASHGYIVVALDQPGAAAAVVFPDGHQVTGLTRQQFRPVVGPSYMGSGEAALHPRTMLPSGRVLPYTSIVPYLAQDAVFALDQLAALNQSDPNGILTGKLDLQRMGTFAGSLGGIVSAESCRLDARLRACLMMDAPMPVDVVTHGLRQPSMWITRDAATMRLERHRAGGWPEDEIAAHQTTMRAVYEGLGGAGYFVQVPGTFHSNFTDIASWTPLARHLGLAGPINAQHAHEIINAYTLAFFDRHLLGRPAPLLDGLANPYPEVVFEKRQP